MAGKRHYTRQCQPCYPYAMNRYSQLPWQGDFYRQSPLFRPLLPWAQCFAGFENWPGLDDYESLLRSQPAAIHTRSGQRLTIVPQDGRPQHFHEHYAPRIHASGELQTRYENWHDFFQLISWMMFPKSKAVINALHIPMAQQRFASQSELGRRSPLENALSLFDEGGALVVSSDPELLQLVRDFKWRELFWERRATLCGRFDCIVFGHAVFEKALLPYVGMTANAILLCVEDDFFSLPVEGQLSELDINLTSYLQSGELKQPRDLSPFPLLGMPGWYSGNDDELFYENRDYFRPGRRP